MRTRALVSGPEPWSQLGGWRCLRRGTLSNHAWSTAPVIRWRSGLRGIVWSCSSTGRGARCPAPLWPGCGCSWFYRCVCAEAVSRAPSKPSPPLDPGIRQWVLRVRGPEREGTPRRSVQWLVARAMLRRSFLANGSRGLGTRPSGCMRATTLPLNDFEREDAETLYEEDEPEDDAWRADFANWERVQKSVQRVFRSWEQWASTRRTVKCGKLFHEGEREAASRLSWQPIEVGYGRPQENDEPRTLLLGQEWPPSVERDLLYHVRSRIALWMLDFGWENDPSPPPLRRYPCVRRVVSFFIDFFVAVLGQAPVLFVHSDWRAQRGTRICEILLVSQSEIFRFVFFFSFFFPLERRSHFL